MVSSLRKPGYSGREKIDFPKKKTTKKKINCISAELLH
jgi:hypothetical protein